MKTIINKISEVLGEAFSKCGYDESFGRTTVSNRPDLCQFQCNGAMVGAKVYKKNPLQIANEVIENMDKSLFSKVEVVPPGFINLTLTDEAILDVIKEMNEDKDFGICKNKNNETVVVDYGGPNVAKPLHVGHLRSAIIGEAIKRMASSLGYNAIGDVHLGDWGLQMGLIITEYAEQNPNSLYLDETYNGEYEALDISMDYLSSNAG